MSYLFTNGRYILKYKGSPITLLDAESCLRRSLKALLDMGRHILAKAYGRGVTEYTDDPILS